MRTRRRRQGRRTRVPERNKKIIVKQIKKEKHPYNEGRLARVRCHQHPDQLARRVPYKSDQNAGTYL